MAYEKLISKIEQIEEWEQKMKKECFNSVLSKLKTLEDMNYIERCRKMIETKERIRNSSVLAALTMKNHPGFSYNGIGVVFSRRGYVIDVDLHCIIVSGNGIHPTLSSENKVQMGLRTYSADGKIYDNVHTKDETILIYSRNDKLTLKIDENNYSQYNFCITPEILQRLIDNFNEFEKTFYNVCEQIIDKVIKDSEDIIRDSIISLNGENDCNEQ